MVRHRLVLLLIVLGMWVTIEPPVATAVPEPADPLRMHLQELLDTEVSEPIRVAGNPLLVPEAVRNFYARRSYRLAWATQAGPLPCADVLVEALHSAADDGLDPQYSHHATLEARLAAVRWHQQTATPLEPVRVVELDILLSDAFIAYATRLTLGSFPQYTPLMRQASTQDSLSIVELLQQAIENGRMAETLRQLLPPQSGYTRLRQALRWYRQLATSGEWPQVPAGPTLRRGDRGDRVRALRTRLLLSGDLARPLFQERPLDDEPYDHERSAIFDEALESAVRHFQQRHGLPAQGIVGRATLAALNMPMQERVRRIIVNLERWRHQRVALHDRYIQVNIPAFTLDVMEHDRSQMTMRVIVGKEDQQTPIFHATITHVVLNPYWQVPSSIAKEEILPRLRQDPLYLHTHKMRVVQGWGMGTRVVDAATIDWTAIRTEQFPYRFRQEPGPQNALGRVKFRFSNDFSIYMHDTPARTLFTKAVRTFSHGCVRVERPLELAAYLLQGTGNWTPKRIRTAIARGEEQWVNLSRAIPVQMVYRTVWVDEDGTVHFRPDIYGYDAPHQPAVCGVSTIACS